MKNMEWKFISYFFVVTGIVNAFPTASYAQQYVRGHYRSDGTYVQGYERSRRDNTVTNNYSYSGNTNPYTGEVGRNHYQHDTTSPYYSGPDAYGRSGHNDNSSTQDDNTLRSGYGSYNYPNF